MASKSNIFVKPWFVGAIIICCFAILMPRIIIPMVKQLFGLAKTESIVENTIENDRHQHPTHNGRAFNRPPLDGGSAESPSRRSSPIHGGNTPPSSTSRSVLTFLLPVYAVGIVIYMVYTLIKVFSNKNETNSSASVLNNVRWSPENKEFLYDCEDNANYEGLDADYVAYLKKKRAQEKKQKNKQKDNYDIGNNADVDASLHKMKEALNTINLQLIEAEKKGGPMDDTDLYSLKLQLANTESKMSKILNMIEAVEFSKQQQQKQQQGSNNDRKSHKSSKHRNSKKKKNRRRDSDSESSTSTPASSSTHHTSSNSSNESENESRQLELKKKKSKSNRKTQKKLKKSSKTKNELLDDDQDVPLSERDVNEEELLKEQIHNASSECEHEQ